jgi:DNA-binding transcriptional ArsR family regulator
MVAPTPKDPTNTTGEFAIRGASALATDEVPINAKASKKEMTLRIYASAIRSDYIQTMRTHEESLSSEQCRRILAALESEPKSREQLVKVTKLTLGSVNKHLAVLRVADLVEIGPDDQISVKR